jgi:hypothetical protein
VLLKPIIVLALLAPAFAADSALTVHEWGTFTSVAAENGSSVPWVSLAPPADLPCFVYHLSAQCVKCGLNRVRMETPVLYFYSPQALTASVHVDLPGGLITEWYPKATVKNSLPNGLTYGDRGNVEWSQVEVLPGGAGDFPTAGDRSHYYAARETDSAPLRVGDQAEKVLFYRGIADFDVPLEAGFLPDGRLAIRNTGKDAVQFALLFENQGGKVGYRLIGDLRSKDLVDPPELTASVAEVRRELALALTAAGLYPKEAAAMVETWRDSWFEEGMRLFYLMPRGNVDAVLPIKITPEPHMIERVFVGRVELLSPAMSRSVAAALVSGDTNVLARCRRFLRPWADMISGRGLLHISQAAADFMSQSEQPQNNGTIPCRVEPLTLPTEQR